jgi:adenylate cyclase
MTLPQAERRLTAIMVADVVGYSRLVEADETETLAAMKHLRHSLVEPLLAEHRGRIVKLMGDGIIAEFGSVVGAVACAADLQSQVRRQPRWLKPGLVGLAIPFGEQRAQTRNGDELLVGDVTA